MHHSLLEILACPACRSDAPLVIQHGLAGEHLEDGALGCPSCGKTYPVTSGIPRFVPAEEDYCRNFGFQWQRWKTLQIDRLSGHCLSESRFFDSVPWTREWMSGKLVLDVGCGAGRFTDVAAMQGARVVACDISEAVDACRENTRVHGDRVETIQASIYALPFRRHCFDAAYCFGVIQHTPDPALSMETIPRFVRPGGMVAYDFYEKTIWEQPWVPHFLLRRFTPGMPRERQLLLAHVLTSIFFLPGWLIARAPLLRHVVPCLPIAMVTSPQLSLADQYRWTVLDTFDWYGPQFEKRQHHRDVAGRLTKLGLQGVTSRYGIVSARVPDALPSG